MIGVVVGWFIAAFVGAIGREIFDRCKTSRRVIRYNVRLYIQNHCNDKLIELQGSDQIAFHALETQIEDALNDRDGGVWIFGAPSGSGKSTYLQRGLEKLHQNSPQRLVSVHKGVNILKGQKLHEVFGVPNTEVLSSYLPNGTVLVIDHLTTIQGTTDYVVELATDSHNSKVYSVIICVSDPNVMLKFLSLNGGEKIKDICVPVEVRWGKVHAREYISKKFLDWTVDDQESLIEACEKSYSPGVLMQTYNSSRKGHLSVKHLIEETSKWDGIKMVEWTNYGHVFKSCDGLLSTNSKSD
jgi:hypothetical protein